MSQSASGIPETSGKNVQAKSGLNQAILDQSGFEFRRQLAYKARFDCVDCGFEANADLVGAINVLRVGHAPLACAKTSPGCKGVEPRTQEATQAYCLSAVGILVLKNEKNAKISKFIY
ncbi:MAG: hypothetical protein RQ715_02860 [Methylococcales bacterium]|nr:hypothetical protein [Methylococcales bacterium]